MYIKLALFVLVVLFVGCGDDKTTTPSGNAEKVTIGTQVWMTQNLDVTKYRNGDPIRECQTDEEWRDAGTKKEGAWCFYSKDSDKGVIYGKLYNWHAVNDSRGLAPAGWRIASDAEWNTLIDFLGGALVSGGALKSTTQWQVPNEGATNSSGFKAIPGGYRYNHGTFNGSEAVGAWWTSTEHSASHARYKSLINAGTDISSVNEEKEYGLSVRCIQE